MKVKEYCTDESPCSFCQKLYDECNHQTVIKINTYAKQCLFCYEIIIEESDDE